MDSTLNASLGKGSRQPYGVTKDATQLLLIATTLIAVVLRLMIVWLLHR
jgi:hypothetical protein